VTEGPPGSHRRRRERHRRRPEGTPEPTADNTIPDQTGSAAADPRAADLAGSDSTGSDTAPANPAPANPAPADPAPANPALAHPHTGTGPPGSGAVPIDPAGAHPAGAAAPGPTAGARAADADRGPRREEDGPPRRRGDSERGLRGLVGAGPSQLGVSGAMRARDAARPTAEDIAAAESDLVIVRRHYVPPEPMIDPGRGH
jgi:hypothetical protein